MPPKLNRAIITSAIAIVTVTLVLFYTPLFSFFFEPADIPGITSVRYLSTLYSAKQQDPNNWIHFAAEGFASGSGSADDPFIIETPEQLAYLAKYVNSVRLSPAAKNSDWFYCELSADINLKGKEWTPIGIPTLNRTALRLFFNGNGKRISGLTIRSGRNYSGLFGNLCVADIRNVYVEDADIEGNNAVGGIAGAAWGVSITDCSVSGKIKGNNSVGGWVGITHLSRINYCTAEASINGNNAVGGGVGRSINSSIFSCGFIGNVNGKRDIGGAIGSLEVYYEFGINNLFTPLKLGVLRCIISADIAGIKNVGGLVGTIEQSSYSLNVTKEQRMGMLYDTSFSGTLSGRYGVGGAVGSGFGVSVESCTLSITKIIPKDSIFPLPWRGFGILAGYASNNSGSGFIANTSFVKSDSAFSVVGKQNLFPELLLKNNLELREPVHHLFVNRRYPLPHNIYVGVKIWLPWLYGNAFTWENKRFSIVGRPFLMPDGDYGVLAHYAGGYALVHLNTKGKATPLGAEIAEMTNWIDLRSNRLYGKGNGTESEPFEVSDPENLAYWQSQINAFNLIASSYIAIEDSAYGRTFIRFDPGGHYIKLAADIDLTGKDWVPVVLTQTSMLNGNGKTLKGIQFDQFFSRYVSIDKGDVKNLFFQPADPRKK